jgi:hypothetical protein
VKLYKLAIVALLAIPIAVPVDARALRKATVAEQRDSIQKNRMPNLVGWDLNDVGDGTGVLYVLHARLGVQRTRNAAHATIPEGAVIAQTPIGGATLPKEKADWTLVISDGGPVVKLRALSKPDQLLAKRLGIGPNDPIRRKVTSAGPAYKTDEWLFASNCKAVDLAYRTFGDARYDNACDSR